MTNSEYRSIPDNFPQLRADLVPLYDLKPDDYNRIVNELTNLLIFAVHLINESGDAAHAHTIIERGVEILRNYDDDVAEFVETVW